MKPKTILFIFALVMLGGALTAWPREEIPTGYGKLTGWVVDPTSGRPVDEKFRIYFLQADEENPNGKLIKRLATNDSGFFSKTIEPGQYCLQFEPQSRVSKYSFEPYPYYDDRYKFMEKLKRAR